MKKTKLLATILIVIGVITFLSIGLQKFIEGTSHEGNHHIMYDFENYDTLDWVIQFAWWLIDIGASILILIGLKDGIKHKSTD